MQVQNKWRMPLVFAGVGALSFLLSFIAAGMEYRAWEESGELHHQASSWIVAWHGVSLAIIIISVLFLIWQLLQAKRK